MTKEKGGGDQSLVESIVARLKNSWILAPLIVLAIIVVSLASFTNALSSLVAFFGFDKPKYVASAGGPKFDDPRLNGLTLDGCVLTMKSQTQENGDPDACNVPSQMEIASQFCVEAKYSQAATFTTEDTGVFHNSYKLAQVLTPEGEVKYVWNNDRRGGFVFTSITCE